MKVHRVTLMVIDFDGIGADRMREVIESTGFANRCIMPRVAQVETREIEWSDSHELNRRQGWLAAFVALFR